MAVMIRVRMVMLHVGMLGVPCMRAVIMLGRIDVSARAHLPPDPPFRTASTTSMIAWLEARASLAFVVKSL